MVHLNPYTTENKSLINGLRQMKNAALTILFFTKSTKKIGERKEMYFFNTIKKLFIIFFFASCSFLFAPNYYGTKIILLSFINNEK